MPNYGAFISGDPIYAQAKLTANTNLAGSLRQAVQKQYEMLLHLGNPALARSVFQTNPFARRKIGGKMRDTVMGGTIKRQVTPFEREQLKAIRMNANPETGTSIFAQIGRNYNEAVRSTNDQMNSAGLFYSGARAKGLGDLARGRQFEESNQLFGAQQNLNSILDMILGARKERRTALTAAAEQAYQRALAQQIGGL